MKDPLVLKVAVDFWVPVSRMVYGVCKGISFSFLCSYEKSKYLHGKIHIGLISP